MGLNLVLYRCETPFESLHCQIRTESISELPMIWTNHTRYFKCSMPNKITMSSLSQEDNARTTESEEITYS